MCIMFSKLWNQDWRNSRTSYVKDVLLENGMENNADQSVEEDGERVFNSIVVQRDIFRIIT